MKRKDKIPRKYKNTPWCVYEVPIGEESEFYHKNKLGVGDVCDMVTNVNLFSDTLDISNPVWRKVKVLKVIHENYYHGVVVS